MMWIFFLCVLFYIVGSYFVCEGVEVEVLWVLEVPGLDFTGDRFVGGVVEGVVWWDGVVQVWIGVVYVDVHY